jgi:hypothetical protein
MDTAAEMAKGQLDGDTCWMLFDMLKNRWGGDWGGEGIHTTPVRLKLTLSGTPTRSVQYVCAVHMSGWC